MAVINHPPHDRNIQLLKTETLGSGSFGVVYKAMCGQHLCAAKLLHPIFFQSNDPSIVTTRRRFEQECHFLNYMKHPNIVEYLGTSHDPDSGLLVLLMELMDESLTHFLEQSQQPLAYHIEVDLCHDIAQALAYIHSKEIIHRDLSSNNILLIAGRAKITDFGMSKLLDVNRCLTPLTTCPGTLVYMPPEALRDPPVYTTKIDCFSFGVLQIQIMTRQFPDPGPAMQVVEDSRSPTGTTNMPILDCERRKSHIDLIDPTHALLPTALWCLSYLEKDRPTAQDLCQQLATCKETPRYMQLALLREQNHQLRQELQTLLQRLQIKDQQLQDSYRNTHSLQQQLQEVLRDRQQQNQQLTQQKTIRDMKWQKTSKAPEKMSRGSAPSDSKTAYFNSSESTKVHSYDPDTQKWLQLPDIPHTHSTLVVVQHVLTMVGGYLSGKYTNSLFCLIGMKWLPRFPAMPTARGYTAAVCIGHSLIIAGGYNGHKYLDTVEVLDTNTHQWSTACSLPNPITVATVSIYGERLYLMDGGTHLVITCSVNELLQCQTQSLAGKLQTVPAKWTAKWQHVADTPYYGSSCATLCGQLVAVGGLSESGKDTTAIFAYNETTDRWEAMGDMPTARREALIAILNGKMMVVGGRIRGWWRRLVGDIDWTEIDAVEILC